MIEHHWENHDPSSWPILLKQHQLSYLKAEKCSFEVPPRWEYLGLISSQRDGVEMDPIKIRRCSEICPTLKNVTEVQSFRGLSLNFYIAEFIPDFSHM